MFPPKQPFQPGAQPQGQPQVQPPQQPPGAEMQPQAPDAGMDEHVGPSQVADIGFNQDVQNIVLSRIQTMTPQEEQILDAVINPQTAAVFIKILPELKPLFDMMSAGGSQGGGPIGQPGAAAPPQAPQAPQAAPAFAAADEEERPGVEGAGSDDGTDDEEEEEENPLLRNGPVSRGLVG